MSDNVVYKQYFVDGQTARKMCGGISRYLLTKLAKECGAIIKLCDRKYLYDVEKIANYMRDTMGLAPVVPGSDQNTTAAETAPKANN